MALPLELLELIFEKLSLINNLINCRATCRSWRKAADAVFTSKLPLMLSLSPSKPEEPNLASLSAPWSNDDESSTVLTETWPQSIDPSDIIRFDGFALGTVGANFQRLSLMDNLMNCRATCRTWRKAADTIFTSKLPLMLSLSPSKPEEPNNLASLSAPWSNDDKSSTVLTETWPQSIDPSDVTRVQSVQGWLMFNKFHHVIDKDRQTFCEISFFNPFSRARFKLPWLFLFSGTPWDYQVRVVFNSAPPGSEDFFVVFLCLFIYEEDEDQEMKQRVAFIKLKQGSWIECTVETNDIFYDIAVDDNDKLYALTLEHEKSVVLLVLPLGNNDHDHVVERLVTLDTIKFSFILTRAYYNHFHRLAMDNSIGELLLVQRDQKSTFLTGEFHVYKLEKSSLKWCEVFDIGDRFLLWDYTRVSFVSAKGLTFPEQFKGGNCIFFCHGNTVGNCGRGQFQDHDIGVFFLGDRTVTHFPISSSLLFSCQNMWFSPAPILN
ncbi:hypothetical protein PIB30_015328 [Stylosanthes scabra]|uniref:F-box domain-containing protein n=1 Tax=Stylosanthes scabra TaxID=79078 RepID=A0ABU6Q6V8_9FABA|nr:hypothetical protein [Stylosanthes scabra]